MPVTYRETAVAHDWWTPEFCLCEKFCFVDFFDLVGIPYE